MQDVRLISAALVRTLRDGGERAPLVVLATCVAATLFAVVLTQQAASRAGERAFEASAAPVVRTVDAILRTYTSLARVSSVLFDPSAGQARSVAGRYMVGRTLSEAYPAAELFAFVRRVPDKDLEKVAGARTANLFADENGLPAFNARPAPGQAVHLLLEQVYPDDALGGMLGEDLSADPTTASAMLRAEASRGVVAITQPASRLVADGIPVLVAPVYDPLVSMREGAAPVGFVLLKANFGRILGAALGGRVPGGYSVSVSVAPGDVSARSPEPSLFVYSTYKGDEPGRLAGRPPLVYQRSVELGLQAAMVTVTAPEDAVANPMSLLPLYSGLAGLAMSVLVWLAATSLNSSSRRAIALAEEMTAAARHSDQRFRTLVESSHDWIWEVDAGYRFTYTSPNCQALLGFAPREILGKPYGQFVAAAAGEEDPFRPYPGGQPQAFQARVRAVRRKDGEVRMMESAGAPFSDARGKFAGMRGIDRDVTSRIRLRDRLAELQMQLETAGHFNLASQLLAGMAHELNQPLSAIALYNQSCIRLIESGSADLAEVLKYMRASADKAAQAGEIIRRLRRFMAKREIRVTATQISGPLGDALALVESHLKGQNVEVTTEFEARLPPVQVDTVLILQVMLNLISNAAEAMRDLPFRRLHIRVRRANDGRVAIEFADTGAGVPPEARDRLFDWYFTTKSQGMGLGLAISRSIVEAHEGTLTFAPSPGGGSLFTISLPAAKEEEEKRETAYH